MDRFLFKSRLRTLLSFKGCAFGSFRDCIIFAISMTPFWVQAIQPVHDATSCVRFGEMITTSGKMLTQLQGVSNELSTLNAVLGSPVDASQLTQFGKANWIAADFGNVLSNLTSPHGDTLSSLNTLGSNHLKMEDQSQYLYIKDYAQSKLFPEAPQNPLSFQKQDEIRANRYQTLRDSSINSVALSGQQKGSLTHSNKELQTLSKHVQTDQTLQDEIRTTNQLLVLIVNELTQSRALLAQHLELEAAVVAHQLPVVFNTTSLSKAKKESSPQTFQSSKRKF